MLVLSRKSQESVVVGGADGFDRLLKVTVLAIQGGRVKLGFEIDSSIPVYREEVWERTARRPSIARAAGYNRGGLDASGMDRRGENALAGISRAGSSAWLSF